MRDYGIKHSTLIEACTNNGNHRNSQETSNNGNGSGRSDDYGDGFWDRDQESNDDTNQNTCSPCNEYGILLKHLRSCPEPEIALPLEIRDLSLHYQEIEESIRAIQNTIQDLSTDSLLV